jgi:hypothetical protein
LQTSFIWGGQNIVPLLTRLKIDRTDLKKVSVMVLILANLVPILGVVFMDWQVFPVLFLFWMENVIIGASNILKMIACSPGGKQQLVAKAFLIPFFCIHYGVFTAVHGVFVIFLFGMLGGFIKPGDFTSGPFDVFGIMGKLQLWWSVLALAVSHAVSFGVNYVGNGEYKKSNVVLLMLQPYGRVVIMHITVLFGGFLVILFGSPIIGLILLIFLKTFIDILAHLRQHRFGAKDKSKVAGTASL